MSVCLSVSNPKKETFWDNRIKSSAQLIKLSWCWFYDNFCISNKTASRLHAYLKDPSGAQPLPSTPNSSLHSPLSSHPHPFPIFSPSLPTPHPTPNLPYLHLPNPLSYPSHPSPLPPYLYPTLPCPLHPVPYMVKICWLLWEHECQLVYPKDRQGTFPKQRFLQFSIKSIAPKLNSFPWLESFT